MESISSISFKNVIPEVFASREKQGSDIWQQDICLEKGKRYLIEADSGKGKSTFCSYVIGYRNDYTGTICFDDTDIKTLKVADWVRIRQRHLSCLFQELRLFPELSAYENVEIKNNCRFGIGDEVENETDPHIYNSGLVCIGEKSIIPENITVGKNTCIFGETVYSDYQNNTLASGKTLIKAGESV